MGLAAVADRLYALTPAQFIGARTEESARAKQAGDGELAAGIKALPKPSSSAWLVNALARRPGGLEELLELGAALREAQQAMDGDQLRQLSRQRHQAIRELLADAAVIAEDAGGRLADPIARGVAATLEAAVVDEGATQAVRSGLLVRALTSTGFDPVDLDGAVAVDGPTSATPGRRVTLRAVAPLPADRPERSNAAQWALAEAGEHAATAERALIAADATLDSVTANLDRARAEVVAAERAVLDARGEVTALEKDRIRADRDRVAALRRRDAARRLLAKAQSAVDRTR
ncbi:MAG: hypothetical protein ABI301_01480 [Jatrophihabitantaceae bacterium]